MKKKQNYIDRLNRRYEQIVGKNQKDDAEAASAVGPLEATIHSLKIELEEQCLVNEGLQKDWIKLQTSLVEVTEVTETKKQMIAESQSRQTLLSQKKIRLEAV